MPGNTDSTIQKLNDSFRKSFSGGRVLITKGVQSLEETTIRQVVQLTQGYTDFNEENDPYGEHNFGSFDFENNKFFWKIDYYDNDCEFGSPDPSDPNQTTRVLTIMFASEY